MPIYSLLYIHSILLSLKIPIKLSTYKLYKIGDKTPPCLTPVERAQVCDIN